MPLGGDHLHVLQADVAQVVAQPVGAPLHVLLVLALGADAGDGAEFPQFFDVAVMVGLDEVNNALHYVLLSLIGAGTSF